MKTYRSLCNTFRISPDQVQRRGKIDMLVSAKSNHLMSDRVIKVEGGMKLYSEPLGKTFSGVDGSLEFQQHIKSYPTKILPVLSTVRHSLVKNLTDKEIIRYFKEEIKGEYCRPRCGNCEFGEMFNWCQTYIYQRG